MFIPLYICLLIKGAIFWSIFQRLIICFICLYRYILIKKGRFVFDFFMYVFIQKGAFFYSIFDLF